MTMSMTVNEWIRIEDNPIKRNSERHAAKAVKNHLKELARSHHHVSAAILPDGFIYKLDGHTRAYLWKEETLERPDRVTVDVYKVQTVDEVIRLYKQFDNPSAQRGCVDKLHGAYRCHGFKPESTLLNQGGVTPALQLISDYSESSKNIPIYEVIGYWIDELKLIDKRKYRHTRFQSSVLAALFLTTKEDGSAAFAFWDLHDGDLGSKNGKEHDGAMMLSKVINDHRHRSSENRRKDQLTILSKTIACYLGYMNGKSFFKMPSGVNFNNFIRQKNKRNKR